MSGMVYDSMNGVQGPYARKVGRMFLRLSRFKLQQLRRVSPAQVFVEELGAAELGPQSSIPSS